MTVRILVAHLLAPSQGTKRIAVLISEFDSGAARANDRVGDVQALAFAAKSEKDAYRVCQIAQSDPNQVGKFEL